MNKLRAPISCKFPVEEGQGTAAVARVGTDCVTELLSDTDSGNIELNWPKLFHTFSYNSNFIFSP